MDNGDSSAWLVVVVTVGDRVSCGYRGGDVGGGFWIEPFLNEEDCLV